MNLALGLVTPLKLLQIKGKFSTTVFMFPGIFLHCLFWSSYL